MKRLRLRRQPVPIPRNGRKLVFALGPVSGQVIWFLIDARTREIFRQGYVRQG